MSNFNHKIEQVKDYFNHGNYHLGIRRLIDCALDTQNTDFFKMILNALEKQELKEDHEQLKTDAFDLIEKMGLYAIQPNAVNTNQKLISVNNLSKQYKGSQFKISPLSFELNYGQIVGLVGENGNGKTTLLKLLTKDLEPDSGSIHYHIEHKQNYDLRSQLVYIPQRVPRWYGSLMDNLQLTLAYHGIKGDDNLLWVEMIIARLGLRPYKHLGWDRISSGYRTRFELAKSLLRRPKIMLLDEPLSNLDIISQQTILQDLKFLAESHSQPFGLVLSSQQLYEVEKISDLVIFLKQGTPQYQYKQNEDSHLHLIFEIETECERDVILDVFSMLKVKDIHFNGGVYVIHFDENTQQKDVYNCIGQKDLKLNYIRNITHSSRRFFIQS
ncbi:MAG: ATP-binding cassette domain-containing protein [Bacteroidota bacterium]|nr:ATP-binding cassette domain-containing protein [Bacteroidota bacterium]